MGLENFLFKKTEVESVAEEEIDELDEKGKGRRNFLVGASALAGASMLSVYEAQAQHENEIIPIYTPEDKEQNVIRIREYELWHKELKDILADPRIKREDIMNILNGPDGVPPTDQSILEGTELDRESFFRYNQSWPSIQMLFRETSGSEKKTAPLPWFAHQQPLSGHYPRTGNAFFVNGTLCTNVHVFKGWVSHLEYLEQKAEITGVHINELAAGEDLERNLDRVELDWDRRKMQEDLSGKLVHVPSIHRERGEENIDNTDITSGVAFKITPNFLYDADRPGRYIFNKANTEAFGEELLQSYACIVPPRDTNEDNRANQYDVQGASGSPVFTDEDCAEGKHIPSGIVYGATTIADTERNISYVVLLMHGPDVLGKLQDEVNTLVGMEIDEKESPNKKQLTQKVQMALHEYGDDSVTIDGLYGNHTRQAVYNFQQRVFKKEMLESSVIPGTVDRLTWNALFPEEQDPNRVHLWF